MSGVYVVEEGRVKHVSHDQSSHGRGGGNRGKGKTTASGHAVGSREMRAKRAATISAAAKKNEPATTATLQGIADGHGGKMEGLDFRLKEESKIAGKIERNQLEKDIDFETASADIGDALRYTATFPPDAYRGGMDASVGALEDAGWKMTEAKNYWQSDNGYKGVNTNWEKDGFTMEVQFHTPSSFKVKMDNHSLYSQARDPGTPKSVKQRLTEQMSKTWAAVKIPTGMAVWGTIMKGMPPILIEFSERLSYVKALLSHG